MTLPSQHQEHQPGVEFVMDPPPQSFMENYKAAGKLKDKVALITGGDSGIGRAVAIGYAKEEAQVAFIYLEEELDAEVTRKHIEKMGREALLIKGDIGKKSFCVNAVEKVVKRFGQLDILVNNAAEQHVEEVFEEVSEEQLKRTFDTNVFGMMFLTQAALPHLKKRKGCIINTASVIAYRGHHQLLGYGTTKGAVIGFTRSLANNLANEAVRVNAVAPGPVWTPLIPASFSEEKVKQCGESVPMGRRSSSQLRVSGVQ